EVRQHFFGYGEVCNNAVLHRPDGNNVSGCPAKHIFGFLTDGLRLVRKLIDSNNRGFVDDDTATFGVDQSIRCAQIDREIAGEQTKQRTKVHGSLWTPCFVEENLISDSAPTREGLRPRRRHIIAELTTEAHSHKATKKSQLRIIFHSSALLALRLCASV